MKSLHISFKCVLRNDIIYNNKDICLEHFKINNYIKKTNKHRIYNIKLMLVGLCNKYREDNICQDQ